MREEFDKLAASGKIKEQQIEKLLALAESGYCTHRSWGFGKITTVDTVFSRFHIDFEEKPGHSMDLSFAADTLSAIPPDHILAKKATDLEGLREMAALHHLDLIKLVLQSYEGSATLSKIQEVLVPDVIADDWRKWWEAARKELKKDGHFRVPLKKSEPIVYQAEEIALHDRLLKDLKAAKGLKAKLTVANELLKSAEDIADTSATFAQAVEMLNPEISSHQRTQAPLALDAIFTRDDLAETAQLAATEGQVTAAEIWAQTEDVAKLIETLPAARNKRALQSFKECRPDTWVETTLGIMNEVGTKLAGESAHLLIDEKHLDKVKDLLARLINQHQASSEILLWFAKERSDTFADIIGPEVFRAMITAMERDQFNEKRSSKLNDFILNDQNLLGELIETAGLEVVKDLTRGLQLASCFDDMDKRSLLARIVKLYPDVQALISGDHVSQDGSLVVSWASLEKRRQEYENLVQKKIPANSKEIAIARSYGDLRENHEYKAAKEMQKLLMGRKHELENQLTRARGTDFADVKTDTVSIGTRISVTDLSQQLEESFSILGAWDSDPDQGVMSYLSPLAQALINHAADDEVEFDQEGVRKLYRINSIEACSSMPQAVDDSHADEAPQEQPSGDASVAETSAAPASTEAPEAEESTKDA